MVDFVTNKGQSGAMSDIDDFDLQDFLPYLLNQAAEASSLAFHQIYRERYGMLRTEWRVLFHLGRYGDMTASDIATRAKMHKTKISRAVSALEDRRFLTRSRRAEDRRQEMLSLTAAGRVAYQDLRGEAQRYNAEMTQALGVTDARMLQAVLRRLGGIG